MGAFCELRAETHRRRTRRQSSRFLIRRELFLRVPFGRPNRAQDKRDGNPERQQTICQRDSQRGRQRQTGERVKCGQHCAFKKARAAFYQVTPRALPVYRLWAFKALKVGEDAQIRLPDFALTGRRFQDVRTAFHKMGRQGIEFEESGAVDNDTQAQLADISTQWLRSHRGTEKTFAMGKFEADGGAGMMPGSRLFAAREQSTGRIWGFVTCVPVFGGAAAGGWGLDLMRRRDDAPSGLMEFLIASAAQTFQREGAQTFSLGLSPLAGSEGEDDPYEDELLARGRAQLFARGGWFYSFQGLHAFKEKFGPCWEPRYLIYPGNPELAATIYAVLKAHSPGGLRTFLARRR